MAQFLRPNGTTASGGWAAVGASTLHEATDEVTPDDDTTYAAAGSGDTTMDLGMSGISAPESGTCTFRVRGRRAAARDLEYTAVFQEETSPGSWTTRATLGASDFGASYATHSTTFSTGDVSSWSNAFRVQVTRDDEAGRVTWIEVETPDAAAGGETGAISAGAEAGDAFDGSAAGLGSVNAAAEAGADFDATASAVAVMSEGAEAEASLAALVAGAAAIAEATLADEMMIGSAAALGELDEAAQADDAFVGEEQGAQTGTLTGSSVAGDTHTGAAHTAGAILEGAVAGDIIGALALRLAAIAAEAAAGSSLDATAAALVSLLEEAHASDEQLAAAAVQAGIIEAAEAEAFFFFPSAAAPLILGRLSMDWRRPGGVDWRAAGSLDWQLRRRSTEWEEKD